MSNKSFSIYSSEEFEVEENDQLVIEVAKSHMAFLVVKQRAIAAYELFSFNHSEIADFTTLLQNISADSKVFDKKILNVNIYFNNELCLPVPIFKFNKEISADYLNVAFGENVYSKIYFEHLPIEPGIMNVFRVDEDLFAALNDRFQKFSVHHTYSNIIRRLANSTISLPDELITIQFYNTFIIVAVTKIGKLQLIQTFLYETPEDVLFYLLNISKQFEMYNQSLTVHISGMIDLDFKLYRELITYFKEVVVENVNNNNLLLKTDQHPLHYFTPFFNLAL